MPQIVENSILKGLLQVGERLRDHMHTEAPYRTGDLKASHTVQEVGPLSVAVGTNLVYAKWVHEGTGIYGPRKVRITPTKKKALYWPGARHPVKSVAGQKANPYMERALELVYPEVPDILSDPLLEGIAEEIQKSLKNITIEVRV